MEGQSFWGPPFDGIRKMVEIGVSLMGWSRHGKSLKKRGLK